jgi:hypothetical protein
VALACAVAALADGIYTYAWVSGSYDPGSWLDLGWQLQAVLLAVGAVAGMRNPAAVRVRVRGVEGRKGIPFALGGGAILTSLVGADFFGEVPQLVEVLAVATVAVVVGRMALTAQEQATATKRLDALLSEQTELTRAFDARNRMLAVQSRALENLLTGHERA